LSKNDLDRVTVSYSVYTKWTHFMDDNVVIFNDVINDMADYVYKPFVLFWL